MRASSWRPTLARSPYVAGPGEPRPYPAVAECACEMKSFAWCSRVLLPKPYEAAERRALSGCDPNIERDVMFGLRFVPMVVRRGPAQHNLVGVFGRGASGR